MMCKRKKMKLFRKVMLQDFADMESNLEIIKIVQQLGTGLKYDTNLKLFSLLKNNTELTTNKINIPEKSNKKVKYLLENKSQLHYNNYIETYTDEEFYLNFHMQKTTFYTLLSDINDNLLNIYINLNYSLPIEKSLLITLYYLAKGVFIQDLCDKFDLVPTSVNLLIEGVLKILVQLVDKYIKWPSKYNAEKNSNLFFTKHGYPKVIGALGSIHIHFKPPIANEEIYRNKTLGYSLFLQGISNSNKEFINIFSGFPGSTDCGSVLKHSTLYKKIEETSSSYYFYNKYHLIAGELYPLRSWIMTPFRSDDLKTRQHHKHNTSLLSALSNIDTAFALLQERWKILNFVNVSSPKIVKDIIDACCMLHNFCIKYDDTFDKILENRAQFVVENLNYFDYTTEGELKRKINLQIFK